MKTLVTGGAGFIGSALVDRLLAEGHSVDAIDNLATGTMVNLEAASAAGGDFTFHRMDICASEVADLVAERAPEVVFHLAAQVDVRISVARPAFDAETNIIGSLHILEGARRAGSRKVVFAASGGTLYGEPEPTMLPIEETHPHQPLSPYGVAKKAVCDYLLAYRKLHGLDFTALALANIYGPRQNPHGEAGVVAIFAARLLRGEPCTIFGTGDKTRDYTYVHDVVDAFMRASSSADGLILNIGTGVETSDRELYDAVARAAGETAEPGYAPDRPGDLRRSCLSPVKAGEAMGWKPLTDLDTGVSATVDFFRSRG